MEHADTEHADTDDAAARQLDESALRGKPLPAPGEDKEARGRVCVIGGSVTVPGAVRLAGEAALRAGAGKLQIATAQGISQVLAITVPEALVLPLRVASSGEIAAGTPALNELLQDCGSILIGPGMAASPFLARLVRRAAALPGTVVLDAGALVMPLRAAPEVPFVLTPHAGEMAALCGVSRDEVTAAPWQHALHIAEATRSIVVLKGRRTRIVTPGGECWLHTGGATGLGTSGSGDVLAGLIAGFAARGAPALDAALWGVWVHGQAGARLAGSVGSLGFLARELSAEVPAILDRFA